MIYKDLKIGDKIERFGSEIDTVLRQNKAFTTMINIESNQRYCCNNNIKLYPVKIKLKEEKLWKTFLK